MDKPGTLPGLSLQPNDIEAFHNEGILTFDPGISPQVIDRTASAVERFWRRTPWAAATMDITRIQDAWVHSRPVRELALHVNVLHAIEQLYHGHPRPFQTLNFCVGTEQRTHADNVHFNSEPFGRLCGVWIALEDVGSHQGPVVYYPRSHKLPETNLEDIGLPWDFSGYGDYESYISQLVIEQGYQESFGCVKKGQAIIWSANLLHGGSERADRSSSRLSQVTHYYFENDKYWIPRMSADERFYYTPSWVTRQAYPRAKTAVFRMLLNLRSKLRTVV